MVSVISYPRTYINIRLRHEKLLSTNNWRRDWRLYNAEKFNALLGEKNWDFTSDLVQACWNEFEYQLISTIDGLAPLTEAINEEFPYIIPVLYKLFHSVIDQIISR